MSSPYLLRPSKTLISLSFSSLYFTGDQFVGTNGQNDHLSPMQQSTQTVQPTPPHPTPQGYDVDFKVGLTIKPMG